MKALSKFEYELLCQVRKLNALKLGAELTFTAHNLREEELVEPHGDGLWWLTDKGRKALALHESPAGCNTEEHF